MSDFETTIRHTPKSELHCHLGGSADISTLSAFASEMTGRPLSRFATSIADRICYDPEIGNGIDTYLKRFPAAEMFVYQKGHVARVAYELMETCALEGVKNIDVRFSPDIARLWGGYDLTNDVIMEAITGLEIGSIMYGIKWGLIICCLVKLGVGAAMRHCRTLEMIKNDYGLNYRFGIDVAGRMVGFDPADRWPEVYERAKFNGFITTVHAGEELDAEHLKDVIIHMAPRRIGHGIRAIENRDLIDLIKDEEVVLEVCPSSNVQCIQPVVPYNVMDAIVELIDRGVPLTINTDNRTISNTNLLKEYSLLNSAGVAQSTLIQLAGYSNEMWVATGKS